MTIMELRNPGGELIREVWLGTRAALKYTLPGMWHQVVKPVYLRHLVREDGRPYGSPTLSDICLDCTPNHWH